MSTNDRLIANASIVLREEFDDWAVLFDPETGNAHGLNPLGVFVWKRLDGKHTIDDVLEELKAECEDVPPEARDEVAGFVEDLIKNGLAGYEA